MRRWPRRLAREETLASDAAELVGAVEGSLADHLAVVLSARYAALVSGWDGEMNDAFRRQTRALRALCQDIVELRRGDHCAERLRLDPNRFAGANKDAQTQALEAVIDEVRQWPDVKQAFQDAFTLLRQRKAGPPADVAPATATKPVQPDAIESK